MNKQKLRIHQHWSVRDVIYRLVDMTGILVGLVIAAELQVEHLDEFYLLAASAAIIADANGQPQGILTEQDISRRVAFQVEPDTQVSAVMSTPVQSISGDDFLHHAIARMRHEDIRHLPVVAAGHRRRRRATA